MQRQQQHQTLTVATLITRGRGAHTPLCAPQQSISTAFLQDTQPSRHVEYFQLGMASKYTTGLRAEKIKPAVEITNQNHTTKFTTELQVLTNSVPQTEDKAT
eukprot:m.941576 g.941576  ORF g.941576 m.941576 type:complete len:102 (+) comp23834_c2_seq9:1044-1349(+)